MKTDLALASRALTKRFDSTLALDAVDLQIPRGTAVGLVGRNGSGKTTLLNSALGLLIPTSGQVTTLGAPAERLQPEQLERIGHVDQQALLLDWLSVDQHIGYVASFQRHWDHDLELQLREELEIEAHPRKRISTLSPGMRQRLALLLAVCHRPELLVLDEPVSALDPIARQAALELILDRVLDDGTTVLLSSHVLRDLEQLIDHVISLDHGRKVVDESLDSLKEAHAQWVVTRPGGAPVPDISEPYVLHRQSVGHQQRLIVRAGDPELSAFRQRYDVDVQVERLDLDAMFPALTNGEGQ